MAEEAKWKARRILIIKNKGSSICPCVSVRTLFCFCFVFCRISADALAKVCCSSARKRLQQPVTFGAVKLGERLVIL